MGVILLAILLILVILAIEFVVDAGIMYLICLCFGLTFSWKIVFGIWLVMVLLSGIFKGSSK